MTPNERNNAQCSRTDEEANRDFKNTRRKKVALTDPQKLDRLPPNSVEAEQGVLGCILLSPQDTIATCITKLTGGSEAFYDLRHRAIYEAIVEMYDDRVPIDLITVQQDLKDKNQLEAVGGLAYLAALPDTVPSAANLDYYLEIVREKFVLRQMIGTCTEVVARAYEHQGEVDQLMDEVERDIHKITTAAINATNLHNAKDLVRATIDTIEHLHANQGAIDGLATGFIDFDKMTGGMHPGEMLVIAARPSCGKTSIAMNIAEHVAINLAQPVGVFSLEMTAASLMMRMLCSRARVSSNAVKSGYLSERDFPKLATAAGHLGKAPLHIDDSSGLSILQLRAKARRMHQQYGIKLFVIDYLQLLHSTNRKSENRQQEVADISGGVKNLAKELNVPVITLSQLNRELDKDKNRKPRLSDLRESGAIEQDADTVGMLYKPSTGEDDEQEQEAIPVNLLIAKQRSGPTGDVRLTFIKPYTRFESAAKISDDSIPNRYAD